MLLTGFICQESNSENKLPRYVVLDVSCSDADDFVMLMARCMIIMVLDFLNMLSIDCCLIIPLKLVNPIKHPLLHGGFEQRDSVKFYMQSLIRC